MSSLNSIWMLWARAESSSDQGMIFLVQSLTNGLWDLKSKSCDLTKCRRQAETSTWSQDPRQWCSLGKGEQRSAQELQGRSRHIQEKVEGKPQSCSHVSTWKPPRAPPSVPAQGRARSTARRSSGVPSWVCIEGKFIRVFQTYAVTVFEMS